MVTMCSIMLCVKDFAPEKWNQPHYYLCLKSPPNTFRPLVNGERDDAARLVGDLEEAFPSRRPLNFGLAVGRSDCIPCVRRSEWPELAC